jgi:DnaJ-like protein
MFDRIADKKISDAIKEGEFDNLPGAGKPLDLEEYFKTPEHLRMAHSILKSANCVPQEIELINEIARLERALADARDDAERSSIRRTLADRRTELALILERARRAARSV